MEAHAVFIGFPDPDKGIVIQGRPHAITVQEEVVHLAESVIQQVLDGGQLIVVSDTSQDAEYHAFTRQVKSFVGIPLRSKGKTVGALVLLYVKPRVPTTEEREFFLSIGHQAGVVVENARLFAVFKNLANP
jgi:GAF domain-containing protein